MCNESDEPIFVTKNGYGDMVVMSMKAYEEIIETSIIDNAIAESEAQLEQDGKLYDAKEVLETLRREYFG
jgi:PHD/YefM family antitoxin component YafN of YafNO toxin-antitoxin module